MRLRSKRFLFEPGRESAAPSVLRVRPAPPPPKGPGPGDQAALAFESRELWIAVHVPHLPVLALRARQSEPKALAVLDPDDRNQCVLDADAAALAAGVRIGMSLSAALAAAPGIDMLPRDATREAELMRNLAGVAADFTPRVSLEPPDGVLLEIKPSLTLFGGLRALCARLRAACLAAPVFASAAGSRPRDAAPVFTLAPTALAALVAARAGTRCFITDAAALAARLKPLPLTVLRWPETANTRLAAMGVRTLGALLRLPRAGFAKRFGPAQLADLDRLLGRRAEPRSRVTARERYRGALDLDHEIEQHAALLVVLQPLFVELEQFLRARQHGITALQCRFHHARAAPTRCVLRLAAPEADATRLLALLRERLATLVLPEPVRRCELRAGGSVARALANRPLWGAGERGHRSAGEMPALLEQLRARLGPQAVYGLSRVSEHRPEHAWCVAEPAALTTARAVVRPPEPVLPTLRAHVPFQRPLWLLREPEVLNQRRGRPWRGGALDLVAGPERLESGWWDADIERDYYVASDARGALLWIYRERSAAGEDAARRWLLHGIFG
jgi:protein ImuB